jgi:hypothetical protein
MVTTETTVLFECTCGQKNRVPRTVISHAAAIGPRGAVTAPGLGVRCGKCKREFDGTDVMRWTARGLGWE